MSPTAVDARSYGPASVVDTDTQSPLGGGWGQSISFEFLDSAGKFQLVSSDAGDVGSPNLLLIGLDSNRNILQEVQQPNGLTPVLFTPTFSQLLKATTSASALGDLAIENQVPVRQNTAQGGTADYITLDAGAGAGPYAGLIVRLDDGQIRLGISYTPTTQQLVVSRPFTTPPTGATVFTLSTGFYLPLAPFSTLVARRLFYNVEGLSAAPKVIYDKFFFRNDHATDPLILPFVSMVDPTGFMAFGLAAAVNDTQTVANRLTAPPGIVFSTADKFVFGGTMAAGDRIGVWVRMTLPAGVASVIDSMTLFNLTWTP